MRKQIVTFLESLIEHLYEEYEFELSYHLEDHRTKITVRFYVYETEVLKEFEGSESVVTNQLEEYKKEILKTINQILQ